MVIKLVDDKLYHQDALKKFRQNKYKSNCQDWQTPDDFIAILLDALGVWQFDYDVCCTRFDISANNYITEQGVFDRDQDKVMDLDGLNAPWEGLCYMNPPYGNKLAKFIEKAYSEAKTDVNTQIVALLPQRFENKFYHECVLTASGIYFFRGKKFVFTIDGQESQKQYINAPQPLCLAFYNFSELDLIEIERKLNQSRYTGKMVYGG